MTVARTCRRSYSVFLLAAMFFTQPALALSCRPSSTQVTYELAVNVFMAQIVSAELMGERDPEARRDSRKVFYTFRVLEEFKGKVDYDSFVTDFAWSTDQAHFPIGETNLFFMSENPGFGSCTRKFSPDQIETQLLVQQMREVRDGFVDTFTGLWTTGSNDRSCGLNANYVMEESQGNVTLNLTYLKTTPEKPSEFQISVIPHMYGRKYASPDKSPTLEFDGQKISLAFGEDRYGRSGDYNAKLDSPEQVFQAVLDERPVLLKGAALNNQDIPVLLNGGSPAFQEFALCSGLSLDYNHE